jgi:putative Mg2+ transporter-C (MgtC) family protein
VLPFYGWSDAIESTNGFVRRVAWALRRDGGRKSREVEERRCGRATTREVDAWQTIARTISQEFSDISDLERLTRIVVRLLLAAALGGVLGFERSQQGKSAGLRTHMLVALGAALFVIVPIQAGASVDSITRVLQGVIAGIGFLCAGTILKSKEGHQEQIQGLTTAAGVWLTAAIGLTIGMGHESTAVLSTVLAYLILSVLGRLEQRFERQSDVRIQNE